MNKIFRQILIVIMSLFLPTGTFFAQPSPQKKSRHTNIHLSLWKNVSTQPLDSLSNTWLNIGIFSCLNNLNGVGINLIGSTTRNKTNGIQISGISNMNGDNLTGVQMAGFTNIIGKNLTGISISGLMNITSGKIQGLSVSGLGNIYSNAHGLVLSGLLNFGAQYSSGIHFAGIANVAGKSFTGLSSSGMLSVTGEHTKGLQLSGLANITGENMSGAQIAGIGNVTGGTVKGTQIGLANIATHVKGLQIGLFNYYKESLNGFQLGLVNTNPHTHIQLLLFGGNTTKLNIGARFKNKRFYTILGGGSYYLDFNDKFSATAFYRAGLWFPLYKQLFISGDLGYQHIETFKNKSYRIPARLYALQARLNLEYPITKKFGIFITTGYGRSYAYKPHNTFRKGILLEGGITLF